MNIVGLQKLTLLDYPKKCAAVIFLGGCNFRCPFCHNGNLICSPESLPEDEIFLYLKKRVGILDGVCITGGEPLLNPRIGEFIKKIRALGFLIKLDTNGSNPKLLKELVESGLIDYVAVDIKNSPEKYALSVGISGYTPEDVFSNANFLMNQNIEYEFRTTVVRELHQKSDFEEIGKKLSGAENFFLQKFEMSENVIDKSLTSPNDEDLYEFSEIMKKYVKNVSIRGI